MGILKCFHFSNQNINFDMLSFMLTWMSLLGKLPYSNHLIDTTGLVMPCCHESCSGLLLRVQFKQQRKHVEHEHDDGRENVCEAERDIYHVRHLLPAVFQMSCRDCGTTEMHLLRSWEHRRRVPRAPRCGRNLRRLSLAVQLGDMIRGILLWHILEFQLLILDQFYCSEMIDIVNNYLSKILYCIKFCKYQSTIQNTNISLFNCKLEITTSNYYSN